MMVFSPMELPVKLQNKIVDFLTSLPNIHDHSSQRALIQSAGLDAQLQRKIDFNGPSEQFFQLLIPTLGNYGKLADARDPLEAVLEAAKANIGKERQTECAQLIEALRTFSQTGKQIHVSNPCQQTSVNKRGFSAVGTQRYWCKRCRRTFQTQYRYNACKPGVKDQILDHTMNGSGVRDIWRSLRVSTETILNIIKGIAGGLLQVNEAMLATIQADVKEREVEIFCTCELDEQWSFVQNKGDQRWLWHAVDRATNTVLAYVLGPAQMLCLRSCMPY